MADYKETQIAGKQWKRCFEVKVENPLAPAVPKAIFYEQDVIEIAGKNVTIRADQVEMSFDINGTITIVNPDTLGPTGDTVPESMLYVLLFSKYIEAAKARDAEQAIKAAEKLAYETEQERLRVLYLNQGG